MIDTVVLKRFEALILARGGLRLRAQEGPALQKTLRERQLALRLGSPEAYLDMLAGPTPTANQEWKQLWRLLTNQESYFFRDAEQLGVISDQIWPELARCNRDRSLRVWSAGCSTGEEPYTLAMMLEEKPELADWRISILGTDISEAALERAERGIYGEWSFRALSAARQARFFERRSQGWEVAPCLRRNVHFALNNLFADPFPSVEGPLHDFDLIVCRNVFIYFDHQAVVEVLRKLSASLRPGGFLVCGHAELHDVPLGDLQTRSFPQSVIYQRIAAPQNEAKSALQKPLQTPLRVPVPTSISRAPHLAPKSPAPPAARPITMVPKAGAPRTTPVVLPVALPTTTLTAIPDAAEILERVPAQMRAARTVAAREMVREMVESLPDAQPERSQPEQVAGLCLQAQAQADAGHLDEAQSSCERALHLSPVTALPYLVLARIAEERGAGEEAKALLKKVMYLNSHSVWAPLELSAIYRREGNLSRAAQMQRAALTLLEGLGDEAPVPTEEHALETPGRVGDLKRQLRAELEKAPEPR